MTDQEIAAIKQTIKQLKEIMIALTGHRRIEAILRRGCFQIDCMLYIPEDGVHTNRRAIDDVHAPA